MSYTTTSPNCAMYYYAVRMNITGALVSSLSILWSVAATPAKTLVHASMYHMMEIRIPDDVPVEQTYARWMDIVQQNKGVL